MSYDHELILVKKTYDVNSIGDAIPTTTERAVLCDVKSVIRSEHYAAAAHDLKPEIIFVVNKYEYQREKEVIFEGERYQVIRSYAPKLSKTIEDFESIELVCSGITGEVS